MREPKFTNKCYDCSNRFVCWTNKEPKPEVDDLPVCTVCSTHLEVVRNDKRDLDGFEVLLVKAKCPHKKWYNLHTNTWFMRIKGKWYRRIFT